MRDGRRVVREGIDSVSGGKNPMPADWARAGEYLLQPSRREWRELTGYLAQLIDPRSENPATATADFLRRPSFQIEVKTIKLRIPDTVSDAPVTPAGDLTLVERRRGADETSRITLHQSGEAERSKQGLVYTFTFTGTSTMTYRPGDDFVAELPVRKGKRELKLAWTSSRTAAYQFERLMREPRLHEPDQSNMEGSLAVGVTVTVTDGKFPVVPAMVPTLTHRN